MNVNDKGVLAAIGGSLGVFWYGAFIFGFPGVMADEWRVRLEVGRGEIGSILFFALAAVGVSMFFVGKWQDKVGVRRMVAIGAIVCGLDLAFVAYATELWMLYLWAFIIGGGSCFVYVPALTVVQGWFPSRRGLLSGVVNFTFGVAGAVMAPVFRYLLDAVGYTNMNLWLGCVALAMGLVAAGLTEAPPRLSRAPAQRSSATTGFGPEMDRSMTVRQAARTWSFKFLWLTWALQGAAGIAMVPLSTAFGLLKGHSPDSAVAILVAFNFANGLSRLVTGYLSDLVGRNSTMSATFLAAGASYLALPHMSGLAESVVLAGVIGFAFGSLFAVSAPLAMDCFGVRHFGAIFGLTFTAYGFVAGPIGPSLSGYILDATHGNFTLVFGYLGAFCLISSLLIRFVKPPLEDV